MGRLLLWLLLAVAAWWILRPRRRAAPPQRPPASATTAPAAPAAPETMVDCAACGLHFPASEALRDGGRAYCCPAHRDRGPRRDA